MHIVHTELCYNIRYYAENGRGDEEFPWSCRHCAIYQQYSLQDNASVWVLVQVPLSAQEGLKRIVGEKGDAGHPMQLHLHFLVECERGWRGYVNCLGRELEKMVSDLPGPHGTRWLHASHLHLVVAETE